MNFQHTPQNFLQPPLPPKPTSSLPQSQDPRQASQLSLLFRNQSETFNQKRMKQLVQQIRFKQKMQAINRKKGKYKRSTNNCHKKYIGILKNLLFLKLPNDKKEYILSKYNEYRNSRVYYFIILEYLKWHLDVMDIRWTFQHFCLEVEGKINRYKLEINTTKNNNFIHFRKDEIIQMEYSIQSINYFLRGDLEEAIRVLYKKNKYIIIKRNEYSRTVLIIKDLQSYLQGKFKDVQIHKKLDNLNLNELYNWNRDISFNELESFEKVSRRRSKRNEKQSQEEEEQDIQEYKIKYQEPLYKKVVINQDKYLIEPQVKEQEKSKEQEEKYPLMQLENSYKTITELSWHSWIIQKQKIVEFQMRNREDQLKKYAQGFNYNPQPSNFTKIPHTF